MLNIAFYVCTKYNLEKQCKFVCRYINTPVAIYNYPFSLNFIVDPSLFPRKEIQKRPKETEPSRLSQLLAEYNKLSANPYFEYGKYNGEVGSNLWI